MCLKRKDWKVYTCIYDVINLIFVFLVFSFTIIFRYSWNEKNISSIACEVNRTVFFLIKHILNLKYTKQQHLTKNQSNIFYKQKKLTNNQLNIPYKQKSI